MQFQPDIIERQIDDDGTIEDSFRLHSKSGWLLKNLLIKNGFIDLVKNEEIVELISYHPCDSLSYQQETIVVIYNTLPPIQTDFKLRDYYGVKVNLKSKELVYKYYREYDNFMPEYLKPLFKKYDVYLGKEFGIGFYDEDFEKSDFYDFYFYTRENPQLIYNFYKKPQPEACKIGDVKYSLFGITFRRNDFKECCKLKRYLYPNDLRLEQPELIYGK